jgi:pimeloyl-ACP methyl ester carboxylesterase
LIQSRYFDKSLPTVFYFHGWLSDGQADSGALSMRDAYMTRKDHNVVTVDWSEYSKNIFYSSKVVGQMKIIAKVFAEMLRDFIYGGYDIEMVHLVGHSLG